MKKNKLIVAAIPGVIAVAALVLSLRYPIDADTLVGYSSVIVLLGVVAVEYRLNWKRVFGR